MTLNLGHLVSLAPPPYCRVFFPLEVCTRNTCRRCDRSTCLSGRDSASPFSPFLHRYCCTSLPINYKGTLSRYPGPSISTIYCIASNALAVSDYKRHEDARISAGPVSLGICVVYVALSSFVRISRAKYINMADEKVRTSGETARATAASASLLPTVNPEVEKPTPAKPAIHPAIYVM